MTNILSPTNIARGIYFDLLPIFDDLNHRFFHKSIDAQVRWGQKRHRLSRIKKSIRLGSYQPHNKIITINRCLDQAVVPLICVERIIFHEMLHQYLPAKKSASGRLLVHYREFNQFEKNYPYLSQADLWIKSNLTRLLSF